MKANAEAIEGAGFSRYMGEPNVFKRRKDGVLIKIAVYVDNLLLFYKRCPKADAQIKEFITTYKKRFRIDIRGELKTFLGMEVTRDRSNKTLTLTQSSYIKDIFGKFLGEHAKPMVVPVLSTATDEFMRISGPKDDAERAGMRNRPFLALMGSLIWCTMTHPEISYHTAFLCQHMHDPSEAAWDAALKVLAYLYHVRNLGLNYDGTRPTVVCYSDASWNPPDGPVPFGGHVVLFCGAAVSFSSRKIKIVPQSSAEAETALYSMACKDLRFCQLLLDFIEFKIELPTRVRCDNQAAIACVKNPGVTMRTRHYEIWVHLGRWQYLHKISEPEFTPTTRQLADIFTKALDRTTFCLFRNTILNLKTEAKISI